MADGQLAPNLLRAQLQLQQQMRLVIHPSWHSIGVAVVLRSISRHLTSLLGAVTPRASVAAHPPTDGGLVTIQQFGYLRVIVSCFHKGMNLISFSLVEVFVGHKQLRLPGQEALNAIHPQPPNHQLFKVALCACHPFYFSGDINLSLNKFFDKRELCPVCNQMNQQEIYRIPYSSKELKKYILNFYEPQGKVDLSYLEKVEYILCKCLNCNSLFQKNIPNDEFNNILYGVWIEPDIIIENRKNLSIEYYQNQFNEIIELVKLFKTPPAKLKFLDFGMGWGQWIIIAKALGIQSFGVEISTKQIEFVSKNGVEIIPYDGLEKYEFDFINTEQVFEHLANPLNTLLYLKKFLSTKGLLKISVPYVDNLENRLSEMDWSAQKWTNNSLNFIAPLEHINYYTPDSLLKMFEIANMEIVYYRTNQNYYIIKNKNN